MTDLSMQPALEPASGLQEGAAAGRTLKQRLTYLAQHHSYAFAAILMVVLLAVTLLRDGSFSVADQLGIAAPMILAAMASAPSIIGRGFDLSVSPLLVFCGAVYVVWLAPHGLGGAIAVPIVLGIGTAAGLVTGLIITLLRIQPVVVTLGMYFALQGVNLLVAPNPTSVEGQDLWVYDLAGTIGPIPGAVFTIGIPLAIWYGLKRVPFRGLLYAVGSNDATAFSSGVNVTAVRVGSYALGGLFCGFGGLALTALVRSTNASTSTQYALIAIAAVVLGGTSLAGGRGGLIGPAFGAFSIFLLQNLLSSFEVNPAWLQIVYGAILILAVIIQGALVPEAGIGGLRVRRMPVLHRRRRRRDALELSSMDVAPVGAEDEAALLAPPPERRAEPKGALAQTWARLVAIQERFPLIQVVALVIVFVFGMITLPGLGSWVSIRSILVLAALIGLASCGQTLLILMGGFDLSVSGFIVAGGLMVTAVAQKYQWDFGWALLLTLLGAAILGGFAGYICHRFRINPLVVTLAMGSIAIGLVKVEIGEQANGYPPEWMTELAMPVTKTFGIGIPPSVAIWVLVIVLFALFLHRTRWGRALFATGANPRAADNALVNTRRVWMVAFAFSAVASCLVGILIGGFAGQVVDTGGDAYLFQSVVAVIVGGTIFGGPGDYTRTAVGALFITVLITVLIGHGASKAVEFIVYGGIILVAVAIYGRERRLRDRV
ncbi:MAG: ABC transporter permease [Solirubrobacteraceae bacterium]|nr:ABC transporter permease [Solirubrobacteraceae bacterium]